MNADVLCHLQNVHSKTQAAMPLPSTCKDAYQWLSDMSWPGTTKKPERLVPKASLAQGQNLLLSIWR